MKPDRKLVTKWGREFVWGPLGIPLAAKLGGLSWHDYGYVNPLMAFCPYITEAVLHDVITWLQT